MWQDEASHLTLDQIIRWGGEEEIEGKIKRKEREEEGREIESSTFSLVFQRSDRRFPSEQEEKFFFAVRASSRDWNRGVSTNSKR